MLKESNSDLQARNLYLRAEFDEKLFFFDSIFFLTSGRNRNSTPSSCHKPFPAVRKMPMKPVKGAPPPL
jgi:hypothetical protein